VRSKERFLRYPPAANTGNNKHRKGWKMAKLTFNYPFMKSECILDKEIMTIGRMGSNDISIPSYDIFKKLPIETQRNLLNKLTRISRKHARITYKNGTYFVEDLGTTGWGSSYGTYVSELRLEVKKPYPVKSGDKIKFGTVECIFLDEEEKI